jgi:hypothetical protein
MNSRLLARRRPKRNATALRPAVLRLEERLAPATFVATQFTDGTGTGTLRWAILQADQTPGVNTVVLRPGTYTLTLTGGTAAPGRTGALVVQGNVTIVGAGPHKTQVNASALGDRAFHVTSGNATFSELTITGGHAAQGGGILIDTGNVRIVHCVLASNVAAGIDGGNGQGGALYQSAGSLQVSSTVVTGNSAQGSDAPSGSIFLGGSGEGGGFYLKGSVTAHLAQDTFLGNLAQGGQGSTLLSSAGGFAGGGAIRAIGDSVTITASSFANNRAIGGAGGARAGDAQGGAIDTVNGTLNLTQTTFTSNQAIGGAGSAGASGGSGQGGALFNNPASSLTVTGAVIEHNEAVGSTGFGGGIYLTGSGQPTLTHVRFAGNVATTAGPDIFPSPALGQQGVVTGVFVNGIPSGGATGNTAFVALIYNPGQFDKRTITITVSGPGVYVLDEANNGFGVFNSTGQTWKRFRLTFLNSPGGSNLISSTPTNGKLTAVSTEKVDTTTVVTFSPRNQNEWVLTGSTFNLVTQFSTTQAGTITITEQPFLS